MGKDNKEKHKAMKRTISMQEHADLYSKCEWEGGIWGYFEYGPNWEAITKLGFDKEKIKAAIEVLETLEAAIYEGEDYIEEDGEVTDDGDREVLDDGDDD